MATFNRQEIIEALRRLGRLAEARGRWALMVLAYAARESTRDVDAIVLAPREARLRNEWANTGLHCQHTST